MTDIDWRFVAILALVAAVMFWAAYENLRSRVMIVAVAERGERTRAELVHMIEARDATMEVAGHA